MANGNRIGMNNHVWFSENDGSSLSVVERSSMEHVFFFFFLNSKRVREHGVK